MSKQTEGPGLVLWCESLPQVFWQVGWSGSRHSRVEGPFLSCSAALIARASVRSTTCVQAGERADSIYNWTFPQHAASVVTFRLWNYAVYIIYIMWHIWRPRQEVNLAYWHYWQFFNSASDAGSKCAILSLKKLNKFHVTFHNLGEQLRDWKTDTIGRSCSK